LGGFSDEAVSAGPEFWMPIYSFLFSLCDGGHRAVWRGPWGSINHATLLPVPSLG
jgi:hypothetical protein